MIRVPKIIVAGEGGRGGESIFRSLCCTGPKSFKPYQMILLLFDLVFNWIVDWAHTDPLVMLIIFVFQELALMYNLAFYVMASASPTMRRGLRRRLNCHHALHTLTCLTYCALTCSLYIRTLIKSWPSYSEQLSFSFSTDTEGSSQVSDLPITSTERSLVAQVVRERTTTHYSEYDSMNYYYDDIASILKNASNNDPTEVAQDAFWSPGFVALYVIQRTVAILYYWVSIRATFLLLNADQIETCDKMMYDARREHYRSNHIHHGNSIEQYMNDVEVGMTGDAGGFTEWNSNGSEIDGHGRWKSLRNKFLWSKNKFSSARMEYNKKFGLWNFITNDRKNRSNFFFTTQL